jgi:Flp pilus assembly CpaE family ATPase
MPAIGIFSSRADGATTIAVALATCLSARGRTLLVDLNLDSPEIAPLLDVGCSKTVYHLAYNAQLAPVGPDELEEHIGWRDGLAILPGITHPEHAERITDHFLAGLLEAAGRRFENVVIDLGRLRVTLANPLASNPLLWVVQPSPLGMDALERAYRRVEDRGAGWLPTTRLVLNRVSEHSLAGAERYVGEEYGLEVAGSVLNTADYWKRVEMEHSARALSVANPEHPRYLSAYGGQALNARKSIEALARSTAVLATREQVGAGGG